MAVECVEPVPVELPEGDTVGVLDELTLAVAAPPLALGAMDSEAHSEAVGVAVSAPRGDADTGGEREPEEEPEAVASALPLGAAEAEGRASVGEM